MGTVKTAVSLPEEIWRRVVEMADERGDSRSAIVAEALVRYVRAADTEARKARWAKATDAHVGLSDAQRDNWRRQQRELRRDEEW
jgi:metal-responsive CopG/Arc/MetJ family transcriptional regulator